MAIGGLVRTESSAARPRISVSSARICLNDEPARVVMRRGVVSVGCTDVTPEALRWLLNEYNDRFEPCAVIVVQS